MLRLSASSLLDLYSGCPRKFYYRRNFSGLSIPSKYMRFGTIVHNAIDKYGILNINEFVNYCSDQWYSFYKSGISCDSNLDIENPPYSFDTVAKNFQTLATKIDQQHRGRFNQGQKEQFIRYEYSDDVELLGKLDYVIDNTIYDWKTTKKRYFWPDEKYHFQLYFYWYLYENYFKEKVNGLYIGLIYRATLVAIPLNRALLSNIELAIDKAVEMVYNGVDTVRVPSENCHNCIYKNLCFAELSGIKL